MKLEIYLLSSVCVTLLSSLIMCIICLSNLSHSTKTNKSGMRKGINILISSKWVVMVCSFDTILFTNASGSFEKRGQSLTLKCLLMWTPHLVMKKISTVVKWTIGKRIFDRPLNFDKKLFSLNNIVN